MAKFTVVDGGVSADDANEKAANELMADPMSQRLMAMVSECIKDRPTVAMIAWESAQGETVQLQALITPSGRCILRGLIDTLHEQIHSEEIG